MSLLVPDPLTPIYLIVSLTSIVSRVSRPLPKILFSYHKYFGLTTSIDTKLEMCESREVYSCRRDNRNRVCNPYCSRKPKLKWVYETTNRPRKLQNKRGVNEVKGSVSIRSWIKSKRVEKRWGRRGKEIDSRNVRRNKEEVGV